MKIKIPMVRDENNDWAVMACNLWTEKQMLDEARANLSYLGGDYCSVFWVEIDIPGALQSPLQGKIV